MHGPQLQLRPGGTSQYSRLFSRLFFRLISPLLAFRSGPIWVKNAPSVAESLDPALPVLIYANHTSWFDGFLLMRLQQAIRPKSVRCFPMIEREWVARSRIASLLGAIPIADTVGKTRRAFYSFEAQRRVFDDQFTLLYFPQGRIWPTARGNLSFKRGLEILLPRLSPIQYFPVAIQFEMLCEPRPQFFLTLGKVEVTPKKTLLLEQSLESLMHSTRSELNDLGESFPDLHSEHWQKWNW
jgi:1-acyl-sn-glycerol-3-phosphate acyltransferase